MNKAVFNTLTGVYLGLIIGFAMVGGGLQVAIAASGLALHIIVALLHKVVFE